jgi:cytochrome c oxidase cbb3-type subunit III
MPTKGEKDALSGREIRDHEWDGIQELNTPLPRWWLFVFYACIAFAAVYAVLYPSLPWFFGHSKGALGYTNRGAVAEEMAAVAQRQAPILDRIRTTDLAAIRKDAELYAYAVSGGKAAFADN